MHLLLFSPVLLISTLRSMTAYVTPGLFVRRSHPSPGPRRVPELVSAPVRLCGAGLCTYGTCLPAR